MGREEYGKDCGSCKISKEEELEDRPGGIIDLPGNWILNHYKGPEGFLGWLALSPRFHRMEISKLEPDEVTALGGNIQDLDMALRNYWATKFPEDPLTKVYVIYFSESAGYHLHFHLIPRAKSFSCALSTGKPAWDTPKLTKSWDQFPEQYRIRGLDKVLRNDSTFDKPNEVENLMDIVRSFLWKK